MRHRRATGHTWRARARAFSLCFGVNGMCTGGELLLPSRHVMNAESRADRHEPRTPLADKSHGGPPFEVTCLGLTPRQADVVRMAAEGLTAKETARQLGISKNTVDEYIRQAKERANVSTKAELIAWAVISGAVQPGDPEKSFMRPGAA
jgi:DNA-binding CsgD family transcriptional regulator